MKRRQTFLSFAGLAVMAMMLTLTTSVAAIGTQDGIGTMMVASGNQIFQVTATVQQGGTSSMEIVVGQTSLQMMVTPATIATGMEKITRTAAKAQSFAPDASIAGNGALATIETLAGTLNPGGGFHTGKMPAVSSAIVAASANGSDTKGGGTFHADGAYGFPTVVALNVASAIT